MACSIWNDITGWYSLESPFVQHFLRKIDRLFHTAVLLCRFFDKICNKKTENNQLVTSVDFYCCQILNLIFIKDMDPSSLRAAELYDLLFLFAKKKAQIMLKQINLLDASLHAYYKK